MPGLVVTSTRATARVTSISLRGFSLDHGTDFATTVNSLPVNMPTHGHGRAMPTSTSRSPAGGSHRPGKGPYFARNGDFAAAGSADIAYHSRLAQNFAARTLGPNQFRRGVAAGSATLGGGLALLGAVELQGQ